MSTGCEIFGMYKDNVNSSYKGKTKTDQENVNLSVFSHGSALNFPRTASWASGSYKWSCKLTSGSMDHRIA